MSTVLYLTRNGMLEPLGQSQVLGYLRGLSVDFKIILVSFEKSADLASLEELDRVHRDCEAHGIVWLPQRFRHRPRILAPLLDMFLMLKLSLRQVRRDDALLIHARSYIPAAIALLVHRFTGTPFVFDMRALWPEELITAGRLRRGSLMHLAIEWVERACLSRAAQVISLTHAAEAHLRARYPQELQGKPIAIIPTCADLDRFVPAARGAAETHIYGCLGTVLSGWFRLDWLSTCFSAIAKRDPNACFEVVSRDDADAVHLAIDPDGQLGERLRVFAKPAYEVHEAVQKHHMSVMFFTDGLSKLGSSPTRMGEVLGCGVPVLANAGVGDVARIIEDHRVGVLVRDGSDESMAFALDEMAALQKDPDLSARCRQAASAVFSLQTGTARLSEVWRQGRRGGNLK